MDEDIQKLQAGAELVAFDRALRNVAWQLVVFGIIFAGIGFFWVSRSPSGWINVGIGVAFLFEAVYIHRVRSPAVVLLAGLTLGILAVWLVGSFVIGWIKKDPSMGQGVIGGLLLTIGAWNLLSSYRKYELLLRFSDPSANERARSLLELMRKNKPDEASGIVEWKPRGFKERGVWRLKSDGQLLLMARFEDKTFGFGGYVEQALWLNRSDIRLEREGDRLMSKNLNAKLVLPGAELKLNISAEMLDRLNSILMG